MWQSHLHPLFTYRCPSHSLSCVRYFMNGHALHIISWQCDKVFFHALRPILLRSRSRNCDLETHATRRSSTLHYNWLILFPYQVRLIRIDIMRSMSLSPNCALCCSVLKNAFRWKSVIWPTKKTNLISEIRRTKATVATRANKCEQSKQACMRPMTMKSILSLSPVFMLTAREKVP